MNGGWWRRNAVALVIVALLLPVTAGIIAVNEWFGFDLAAAPASITAQPGEAVDYAGARIGPARADIAEDPASPPATRVVTATVLVTPGEDAITCLDPTLHEIGGTSRQWNEASFELDREYDPERRAACDPELPIRYSLTLEYIVPRDVTGPFAIELESSAGRPHSVGLIIEP